MAAPRIYGEESTYNPTGSAVFRNMGNILYLQPGSKVRPDELGVDVAIRRWICKTSLVDQFRPLEGDLDLVHRNLKYWDCEITENGPLSEIMTRFNGFRDRAQTGRIVKSSYSTQIQEVPVSIFGTQTRVIYMSPMITNRYASVKRPDDSERPAALPEGLCKIIDIRGDDDSTILNASLWTGVIEDQGVVYPSIERTGYEREQQGNVWVTTETVQRILRVSNVDYRL